MDHADVLVATVTKPLESLGVTHCLRGQWPTTCHDDRLCNE
jgi:hypothetical protein